MSATNKTTHYELPVFLGSDKPAWLVDWNGAMADIDSAIYEAKTTADGAASSVTTVAADLATLSSTVSGQGTDISTLSGSLTSLIGTVNTITSLIGNGEPTTTDKTIIGAINEINAKIPAGGISAGTVSYDNTTSGLTADDVQEAIDELAAATPAAPTAAQVSYDNTSSGLVADDVQEAVDELATSVGLAALKSAFTPTDIPITIGQGLSNVALKCTQVGRMLIVNISISAQSEIAANTVLNVTDIPGQGSYLGFTLDGQSATAGNQKPYRFLFNGGKISTIGAIPYATQIEGQLILASNNWI